MSKTFKRFILGISLALIAIIFVGGFGLKGVRAGTQKDGAYQEIEVYSEVLKKIQTDYVSEPSINNVTDGALHGLLESLDANSSYLTPEEYSTYKQHLSEGSAQVGLNVSKRAGYAMVISVLPGSPADKQQIQDGDIIESIDGHSTYEMSLALIKLMLEGKPGSNVNISLIRPRKPDPDQITLTRGAESVPPLNEQQYESSTILYLKPIVLTEARVKEMESRIKAMERNSNKKILLDLRDVVEGNEAEAVRLANDFLNSGTIATLEGQKFARQTFTADPSKTLTSAPLVVLVNHGTAGAGELVAAAIMDNKRGDVVGDRTFGDGTVQKTIELPNGSAVILSIAKYASPSGKKIQDDAVTPNVLVAANFDDQDEASKHGPAADDQLNKALEVLKKKA
jgi:carboxyl-terminal processing protease